MSDNRKAPFKLNIDEKDLRTGSVDRPETRRAQRGNSTPTQSRTAYYSTDQDSRAEKKAHKKRNRLKARKNKRVFSIVWLCMVLLLGLTLASYLITGANDFLAVGRTTGTTEVELPETVDAESLAELLYQRGAINEPEFFTLYAKITVKNWEVFQKGVYRISTDLDYQDIISKLTGGSETREVVQGVTFPEGSNALEIGAILEENEVCTQAEFLAALNEMDFSNYDAIALLGDTSDRYYKLEGYLFPDTYDFYKDEELESVIGKLLYNYQKKMTDTVKSQIESSGMSMDQVITLASIIQAEAADGNDMYNISAVLHNRLSFGGDYGIYRLQCDSTTYYPYKNAQAVPETDAMPYGNYDTYQIEGLPAGPICNPGMEAIQAALHPNTEGDAQYWLYFCHADDGTAYYATTEEEHLYNRQLAGLD